MSAASLPSADIAPTSEVVTGTERSPVLTRAWQRRPSESSDEYALCWPITDEVARRVGPHSCVLPRETIDNYPEKIFLQAVKMSLPSFVSDMHPSYRYRPARLVDVDDHTEFALILALNWLDFRLPEPDLVDRIADEVRLEGSEREPRWLTLVSKWKT